MRNSWMTVFFSLSIALSTAGSPHDAGPTQTITIGSKLHPESRLLAEITAQLIEQNTDFKVNRRFGLGGTLICFEALRTGEIDIYPEYTGTALTAILKKEMTGASAKEIYSVVSRGLMSEYQIYTGASYGFNNSYVLAARPGLNLVKISQLSDRSDLKFGLSNEFIERPDGFVGLNKFYGLHLEKPHGIDHGLAYKALSDGQIDITDAYSTDGKLEEYNFVLLDDDRHFFPPYYAVPLVRNNLMDKYSKLKSALEKLSNILDEKTMRSLNKRYEVNHEAPETIAFELLKSRNLVHSANRSNRWNPVIRQTFEHIRLTFIATFLAILLAVPLGIYIHGKRRTAQVFMSATGIVQTIPSLALLGFMIPLFGIGFAPAIIALFLYALLPILRNTYTGLAATDPLLIEAGKAMGMSSMQLLFQVRLPLAANVIMAGIRTALTINIGTATLAAFIGAGGLGESIITGISLNDNEMILRGAIPAALLALTADRGMAMLEKKVRPRGITDE